METIPIDQNDHQLIELTQPADWSNPASGQTYDLVVIGGGPAGLVSAVIAAGLGAKTALIERNRLGGDCLHSGCVPSKALLASAKALYLQQQKSETTSSPGETSQDQFRQTMQRMRDLRLRLAKHDSAQRLQQLGIDVFFGPARFENSRTISVHESQISFRRCILATGSRPAVPSITGLDQTDYLTNETLFSLPELPSRLSIIGAGPIGVEMAQAFRRFGSQVTVIDQAPRLLPHEDAEASQLLLEQFQREGIQLHLDSQVREVKQQDQGHLLELQSSAQTQTVAGDQLLIATGRQANLADLNLEAAGIQHTSRGVQVNPRLQTSNRRVFAAGDVTGQQQFTHAADAMARLCIRNAFFFGRQRWDQRPVPHTTYTDPEIAQIGHTTAEAEQQGIPLDTYRESLSDVDRCILEGQEQGLVLIHCKRGRSQVVGATVVGSQAGDLINTLSLLMSQDLSLSTLSNAIHCYPTQSQVLQRIGDQFQRTRLTSFTARLLKRIIRSRR